MKRVWIVVIIVVSVALLVLVGMLLYKHFITDQIKDKGGMENPNPVVFAEEEDAPIAEPAENGAEE